MKNTHRERCRVRIAEAVEKKEPFLFTLTLWSKSSEGAGKKKTKTVATHNQIKPTKDEARSGRKQTKEKVPTSWL